MVFFGVLTIHLLAAAAAVSAAPTAATTQKSSKTVSFTTVTHTVVAGLAGLHFEPDNVIAEIGDIVEWHFLPRNHSVAQSNFFEPCQPFMDGTSFFADFDFFTQETQSSNVFQIIVRDKEPIWYYCPQQAGLHCQNGMVGVINQSFDSPAFNLSRYKQLAAMTNISIIPPVQQGGNIIANPNPLSGF